MAQHSIKYIQNPTIIPPIQPSINWYDTQVYGGRKVSHAFSRWKRVHSVKHVHLKVNHLLSTKSRSQQQILFPAGLSRSFKIDLVRLKCFLRLKSLLRLNCPIHLIFLESGLHAFFIRNFLWEITSTLFSYKKPLYKKLGSSAENFVKF